MRRSVRTRLLRERTSAGRPRTSLVMASRPQRPRRTQVGDATRAPTTATDSGSVQGWRGPLRSAAFQPNDVTTKSDCPMTSATPRLAAPCRFVSPSPTWRTRAAARRTISSAHTQTSLTELSSGPPCAIRSSAFGTYFCLLKLSACLHTRKVINQYSPHDHRLAAPRLRAGPAWRCLAHDQSAQAVATAGGVSNADICANANIHAGSGCAITSTTPFGMV